MDSRKWKRRLSRVSPSAVGLVVAAVLVVVGSVALVTRDPEPPVDREAAAQRAEAMASARADRAAEAARERAAQRALRAQVAFPQDRPLRVAFLGDSLTFGSYATDDSRTFTARVTDWLDQAGDVESTVMGVPGYSATQALESFDIPTGQDLVVVMLGNNDQYRHEIAGFTRSYPALVEKVHRLSPSAQVVCVPPYLPSSLAGDVTPVVEDTCDDPANEAVVEGIEEIAADDALRAQVGDRYQGGRVPDGGHPNDAGHAAIARAIIAALDVRG